MALNSVKVFFEDPFYNYEISVSEQATKESCTTYFVGKKINHGRYDVDNFQVCTKIEFTDNNLNNIKS